MARCSLTLTSSVLETAAGCVGGGWTCNPGSTWGEIADSFRARVDRCRDGKALLRPVERDQCSLFIFSGFEVRYQTAFTPVPSDRHNDPAAKPFGMKLA